MADRNLTLFDFNRELQLLTEQLFSVIDSEIGDSTYWNDAVLDTRSPVDGSVQITKFRIAVWESSIKSVLLPSKVTATIRRLWEIKESAFPDKWYGFMLLIFPTGDCKVEFNYDESCFDDPTFFDM
jgi:hypothetical protein